MSTKPTVCLAMILKNESHIIKRCLDSARPYIDGYFIIDTGSTDDTLEVVAREMGGLPGVIKSEDWVDFGYNRSSLVKQAREQGYDYLLLGDADMVFDGELGDLTADSYLIRLSGGFEYWMPYLVSTRIDWHYVGVTHEHLAAPGEWVNEKHPTFIIHHLADGGTRPEKYDRDLALLEAEHAKNPDHDRTAFYLAQTYKDMGRKEESIAMYKRRVEIGGWDEEIYWSLFQIAEMTGEIEDYLRAWCFRPSRPEAVERLVRMYNDKKLYQASYLLGMVHMATHPTRPEDILFVEMWAYDYGIMLQVAVAEYWLGDREASKTHFEELLELELPAEVKALVESNLTYF